MFNFVKEPGECWQIFDEYSFIGNIDFKEEYRFYPSLYCSVLSQDELFTLANKLKELNQNV